MGNNLNSILTELFTRTGTLFASIDMTGKILAHSSPFYVDYSIWMNSVQQGYCDEILMDYIESRRNSRKAPKGKSPSCCSAGKSTSTSSARGSSTSTICWLLFRDQRQPELRQPDQAASSLFAQKAKDIILRLKSYSDFNTIMQNNILLDVIAGATPAEAKLRTKIACLKFPSYMRVLVLRTSYLKTGTSWSRCCSPRSCRRSKTSPASPGKILWSHWSPQTSTGMFRRKCLTRSGHRRKIPYSHRDQQLLYGHLPVRQVLRAGPNRALLFQAHLL